jgi:hypothetical protein
VSDDDVLDQHQAYLTWLGGVDRSQVTPPLAQYLRWVAYDDNLPWRLGSGHLVNLLDQAVEALEAAYGSTNALRETLEAALQINEEG